MNAASAGSAAQTIAALWRGPVFFVGLVGALAVWLGFPNDLINLPPFALLWPVTLALLGMNAQTPSAALRAGWLLGLAGSTAALYWLALPVHNIGNLPWILAFSCAVFIAACLSAANGVFSLAAYVLRERPPFCLAALLALVWYLLEFFAAQLLGFPWLPLAGALAVCPVLVQGADIFGVYALGGLWVFIALLCLFCRADKRCLALGLAGVLAVLSYGTYRLNETPFLPNPTGPESFATLLVEGNIDQNQKWVPAFQRATVDAYVNLTNNALTARPEEKPLIVWPETALPFFFENSPAHASRIRELARASGCPLLFGAPSTGQRGNGERLVFNRAFLLSPEGDTIGWYDKEHLVPFGEHLPAWLHFDFLQKLLQGVGVYEQGSSSAPLRHGALALGMLICYEGIFPWLAEARVKDGANILADISNDAWFGRTPAARQHLYLTALRAIEQNRWILRGTNTGISAVVDTRGRLALRGEQFTAGALFARARLVAVQSPYHTFKPWIFPSALLLFCALLVFGRSARVALTFNPKAHHVAFE